MGYPYLTVRSLQVLCISLFSFISIWIAILVNRVQPTAFIDEIFHIPQATKYCQGLFFDWNPKITTLPGLYLFSVGIFQPIGFLFNYDLCTVNVLRSTNLICAILNFYLIYEILKVKNIHQALSLKILISALNLSIFPVLYFFTFFYYTESLSTSMILLMYILHLQSKYYLSATIGFFSVLVRQTNIVWMFYLAGEIVLSDLEIFSNKKVIKKKLNSLRAFYKFTKTSVKHVLANGTHKHVLGYVCVGLMFVLFLFLNKGIVVGDRTSHSAVLHIPQLFYFANFSLFFSLPYAIKSIKPFLNLFLSLKWSFVLLSTSILFYFIILNYTLVHPYTLADNRHYMFYIWTRFFARFPYFRFLMIPIHMFSFYQILRTEGFQFFFLFVVCVILSLVPQLLVEVRYFIIPFLFYRLHFKVNNLKWWELILEFMFNVFINVITLYIFFTKTFYWNDSPDVQRIIW